MRPSGYAFTIIGGLAFVAGAIGECFREPNPPMVAVIVSGLLNPIFFIGLPLGVYWLRRSKKSHPLAAVDSGKPDSTVPCEEQEQPCTVNRTDDAMHWYHTTGGLLTILTTCICIGIIAAIFFGGPSLPPGNASTSSAVARPASNSVSDEEHRFVEGYRTAKVCQPVKGELHFGLENLRGIRSVSVVVSIQDSLTRDENTFIATVQPDIELRLRQAGIKVVEPSPLTDALLFVDVKGMWSPSGTICTWITETRALQDAHVVRHGQHYQMFVCIWRDMSIQLVGSDHFGGFTSQVAQQTTSLLNDWLAANQP